MIKVQTRYDFGKAEYVPIGTFRCKTNLKTKWYDLKRTDKFWWWDSPSEPTLGPTILSKWSK